MSDTNHKTLCLFVLSTLFLFSFSSSAAEKLSGNFRTPFGVLSLQQNDENGVKGILTQKDTCGRGKGTQIFTGTRLDDSITASVRVCYKGSASCRKHRDEVPVLLLVSPDSTQLTGVAHFNPPPKRCESSYAQEGVVFQKTSERVAPRKTAPVGARRATKPTVGANSLKRAKITKKRATRAKKAAKAGHLLAKMKEASSFLQNGEAERARALFKEVTAAAKGASGLSTLDHANAYNGLGVTFYLRERYDEAMENYKKAVQIDPMASDSYYNLACLFALRNDKEQAFRYLNMAVLNGYIDLNTLDEDPDLGNLREDPRYEQLKKSF